MKYTPTEARALARAKTEMPMTDVDLATLPRGTWTPHQLRLCRGGRLWRAAKDFHGSETLNRLHSVELVAAYRELLELDET